MSSNLRLMFWFASITFVLVAAVTIARGILPAPSPENMVDDAIVEAPCTVDGTGGFLRAHGEYVAIYDGNADGCHELSEMTDIRLDGLAVQLNETLDLGIPFQDKADIPQIIDGLLSGTG